MVELPYIGMHIILYHYYTIIIFILVWNGIIILYSIDSPDKSSIKCSIEGHRSLRTAGDAELALGEGGTSGDLSSKTMWISWVLLVFSHVNIFFYRGFTGINSEITVYIYITNNNMGLLELTMLRGISGSMEVFFWCDWILKMNRK